MTFVHLSVTSMTLEEVISMNNGISFVNNNFNECKYDMICTNESLMIEHAFCQ